MVVQSVNRLFCPPAWRFVFVHQAIRHNADELEAQKGSKTVHAHSILCI